MTMSDNNKANVKQKPRAKDESQLAKTLRENLLRRKKNAKKDK